MRRKKIILLSMLAAIVCAAQNTLRSSLPRAPCCYLAQRETVRRFTPVPMAIGR